MSRLRWLLLALFAGGIAAVTAVVIVLVRDDDEPSFVCTTRGCASALAVWIPRDAYDDATRFTVCADGRCVRAAATRRGSQVMFRVRERGPVVKSVVVIAHRRAGVRTHTTNVRLGEVRPNGPRCGPVCWGADVVLSDARLRRGRPTDRQLDGRWSPYGDRLFG